MADTQSIHSIGRRKEAVCRVFIKPGSGKWDVNGRTLGDYFPRPSHVSSIQQPFVATDTLGRSASNSAPVTVNAVPVPTPPPPVVPTLSAELTCTLATHGQRTDCNVTATYGGTAVMASAITLFRPDWGDGSPQEIRNSPLGQHVYLQAGTYTIFVYLEATTPDGTKATTTMKAVVIS